MWVTKLVDFTSSCLFSWLISLNSQKLGHHLSIRRGVEVGYSLGKGNLHWPVSFALHFGSEGRSKQQNGLKTASTIPLVTCFIFSGPQKGRGREPLLLKQSSLTRINTGLPDPSRRNLILLEMLCQHWNSHKGCNNPCVSTSVLTGIILLFLVNSFL